MKKRSLWIAGEGGEVIELQVEHLVRSQKSFIGRFCKRMLILIGRWSWRMIFCFFVSRHSSLFSPYQMVFKITTHGWRDFILCYLARMVRSFFLLKP